MLNYPFNNRRFPESSKTIEMYFEIVVIELDYAVLLARQNTMFVDKWFMK